MEEACLMGFSGGSEQGKLLTALLQLNPRISIKISRVNSKPAIKTLNLNSPLLAARDEFK